LLTVREVAERLRVCTATFYRLRESGRLWHLRVSNAVRVPEMALGAFMKTTARDA
jgi:excisionase family DNA binding protein